MTPQTPPPQPANSSKVNWTISIVFHLVIVGGMLYFAAREGLLGKKIQKVTIEMVKEKPKEKPKEPEPPKVEPPKIEAPKVVEFPKPVEAPKTAVPPMAAPPIAAPPAAEMPSFDFAGGKTVETTSDPVLLYKRYMEYSLRQKWNRPQNADDDDFVAEVRVDVDEDGIISNPVLQKSSGDADWDQTVKDVFKEVTQIDRRPPTNFPPEITIRFDVQIQTEPIQP
jgi:outer membrane biosynthesis protein TonB